MILTASMYVGVRPWYCWMFILLFAILRAYVYIYPPHSSDQRFRLVLSLQSSILLMLMLLHKLLTPSHAQSNLHISNLPHPPFVLIYISLNHYLSFFSPHSTNAHFVNIYLKVCLNLKFVLIKYFLIFL